MPLFESGAHSLRDSREIQRAFAGETLQARAPAAQVDAALTKLLNARGSGASDSPHDVLAEAEDPYGGGNPKKRPDAVPNDPNKGGWVSDAPADAAPAAIVDSRIGKFVEMGFTVEDAEKALKFCDNDVDAALSMLLQAKADAMTVTA